MPPATSRPPTDQVRHQLEFTQAVLACMGDGLYSVDSSGRVTSLNPAGETMLGWTEAEVLGQNMHDLIHFQRADGRHVDAEACPLLAVVRTGTQVCVPDDVFTRKDGSTLPVGYTSSPIRIDGRVVGAVVAFRDISGPKEAAAEQARRTRRAALRAEIGTVMAVARPLKDSLQGCTEALVRHLDAAFARIWTFNETEHVLELQASAGMYTHIDGGHARVGLGQLKIGRIAQSQQPHLTNDVPHDPWIGDADWARREGLVAFAGYPLVVQGRLLGVAALFSRHGLAADTLEVLAAVADLIAHGIARRRDEEEIRSLNETLERKIEERTARLVEVNRELESFSYSVSHDLRAPLRHINGFVDMLRKHGGDKLDAVGQRYLRIIHESARHAGRLVDDLLAFSRMGRVEMRQSVLSMSDIVEQVRRDLESDTDGRVIHWKIGPLPDTHGDPALIRQVVQNLLSNAIKYTRPRTEARIEVGGQVQDDEVVFSVRDNGVGFDMRYVDKLFGVFQRLHGPEQFEGTGIGLANVRRIIQRHGGRTWAQGEVDRGATFYFTLPRSSGEQSS